MCRLNLGYFCDGVMNSLFQNDETPCIRWFTRPGGSAVRLRGRRVGQARQRQSRRPPGRSIRPGALTVLPRRD